jgi:pyrroline-5-carboxylate reductase
MFFETGVQMSIPYKVGFIGMGNMAQTIIKGLLESKTLSAKHIYASNRTPGKLVKAVDAWGIHGLENNEEVIEACEIIILAMKPQDFPTAIDPIASAFSEKQIVISLAAGVTMHTLQKKLAQCRIARVIPNTPTIINRGVIGYLAEEGDDSLESIIEDMFSPLGYVLKADDEDQLDGLMISCSSGTGFIFELMMYFQEWVEERGFDPITARKMVVETFLGASLLASQQRDAPLEDLQTKVASKKGVTAAGLQSMRELEIERLLRYSFEKAFLRNQELAKQS